MKAFKGFSRSCEPLRQRTSVIRLRIRNRLIRALAFSELLPYIRTTDPHLGEERKRRTAKLARKETEGRRKVKHLIGLYSHPPLMGLWDMLHTGCCVFCVLVSAVPFQRTVTSTTTFHRVRGCFASERDFQFLQRKSPGLRDFCITRSNSGKWNGGIRGLEGIVIW